MQNTTKRKYAKPQLSSHGSVEEITGWHGGGAGEFFGGSHHGAVGKIAFKKHGPADFGS